MSGTPQWLLLSSGRGQEGWGTVQNVIFVSSKRRRCNKGSGGETYHQGQDKAADTVSDLRGDVITKLLQRGQEALQLAELASPTGGWQLLVSQRRGRGGGRPVAVPLWRGRHSVQGGRGVMIPVGHCETKTLTD